MACGGGEQRLALERALDLVRGLLERLHDGDVVPASRVAPGVRGAQHVGHEAVEGGRPRRLALGAVALARHARRLQRHGHREADHEGEPRGRRRHAHAVPPHELAQAVARARRAGGDGLVAKVALQVGDEPLAAS